MEALSLGLIETLGYVAAIEASDAGSKAANVTLIGYERGRAGLITVKFSGDVAAVRAAVTAAAAAASKVGKVVTVHVIARPNSQLHVISKQKAAEAVQPAAVITHAEEQPQPNKVAELTHEAVTPEPLPAAEPAEVSASEAVVEDEAAMPKVPETAHDDDTPETPSTDEGHGSATAKPQHNIAKQRNAEPTSVPGEATKSLRKDKTQKSKGKGHRNR